MAYDFLKTTTYSNDPLAQGDFSSFMPISNEETPLGDGFDFPIDSDLIPIVSSEDSQEENAVTEEPTSLPSIQEEDLLEEPDPQADMDLLNMLFQEEPVAPQRIKQYVPPASNDDEDDVPTLAPVLHNGKITPRIWQYGGKPSKYQTGGLGEPAQTGIGDVYTPLPKGPTFTTEQEQGYQKWKEKLPKRLQYEGNYNLRQFYKDVPNTPISPNMHFPDFYKMPNHPSFSKHSQYMTPTNRYLGGQWEESDSAWTYYPYNDYVRPKIVERKQMGGHLYADDYQTQRIGLNNPNFNTATFNLKGTNTIRGLDNHQPVAVTDGSKYKILTGPQDTAKFKGKVYEKRIK